MPDSINKKINLLIAKECISGIQLTRKLGIPASTIKKIRRKELTNPTAATLAPIAKYLSVTLEHLLETIGDFSYSTPKRYYDASPINWEEPIQFSDIAGGDRSLNAFAELYTEEKEVSNFVNAVAQRDKMPFFGLQNELWNYELHEWSNHFYIPKILDDKEKYC